MQIKGKDYSDWGKTNMCKWWILLFFLGVSGCVASAHADELFVGSQAGLCCFNVDLSLNTTTNTMAVTVTLADGATSFVNSGNGSNHPGFAMDVIGGTSSNLSVSNISPPWTLADFSETSDTTNGPKLGTFDFEVTNPGNGGNQNNSGPLTFDLTGNGLTLTYDSFGANSAGYYFAADIMDKSGATGESGINSMPIQSPVPEPSSLLLLGTGLMAMAFIWRLGKFA